MQNLINKPELFFDHKMKIIKPSLILDEKRCRKNIREMYEKALKHGLAFRPHFKTHQSLEIGRWFKELGINKITVSSVEMAEYFSKEWKDITIAFPVNILEIDQINQLASTHILNLLVESKESAAFLKDHLKSPVGIFIKTDVGSHRTGLDPENHELIDSILRIIEPEISNSQPGTMNPLSFKGFLAHAGHTYKCRGKNEILKVHDECRKILGHLKEKYLPSYPNLIISYGDTPSCSVADQFDGIDEIRPGNFVFYDLSQVQIGSCEPGQIAIALACPVVALHPDRNEIVVYGGGIHLSKERLEDKNEGIHYGTCVRVSKNGLGEIIPGMVVKSLSQEHGVLRIPETKISDLKTGELVYVLPVHSCMTVNLMKSKQITIL